ncbi:MAG: non-ribosomal peptide synthase/polyketide synthase [Acidobacteriota bacterium]|nr:non-ribosomal peptide synthase/polyketide synthase [Acidobacteriota bacterium]
MSKKNIEDTYALSPLQQGMLFHEVDEPGAYFVQITCTLHGEIDLDLFRKAWQQVSDRTPVLRSAFVWKTTKKPLQLVGRRVRVPFSSEDWSDLPRDQQERKLEELLRADREQGIELGRAPLIRITAVRRAADEVFFLWSLSHLILDGWSYPMVLEEVLEHYQAAAAERPPRVGKRRPFRDYIGWLQRQDMAAAEAFWREQLGDVTAPTSLGVDRHQSADPDHRGDGHEETVELPEELTAELNAFTPRHQLTLNTLVEGAWALMLARYSGEKSIVFGAIGSGRPADLPGVEEMIGLFLNTLPVRTRIDDRQPVLEWLRELQSHRLQARQYEFTPLAKIQQWSGVGGGQPLFESSVSFQSYPLDESLAEGSAELAVSDFNIGEEASFPLLLGSMPGPRLPLIVEYQRSRFDDATIHRMLGHLQTLLAEIAAKPNATVGELSLVTAAERTQLLEEWSGELGSYPDQDTVHSLVFGAGEENPLAPAVLCGEVTLSHGELAAASAALARKIVAAGATPGTLVGLCVQRSERLVVGLMGILQAGCAYVPLDPAYPADRLAYMVEDSSAPLVVTEKDAVGQLPEATEKILLDELMEEEPATLEPEVALPDISPDQLAYVIYTSGSTGKPKGVMISHRMVVQYTVEMVRQFGLDASDRVLQFASLSFDVVVEEVYPALAAGAAVVVPSQDLLLSTAELEREITDHGVTGLELPAAYWQEWVHAMVQAGRKPPESLRWILVGCEKPQQERLASWRQWDIPLYIVFGLTETTVTSTLFRLEGEVPGEPPVDLDLPIGKPVVNSRVWVLDDRLEPVPVGVTGQLYIGGLGVGRGYLGRPALTAERFGPDPLSSEEGARWYRTGDLARWRENGDLEFLGRMDHQVKVRGFRVELGEIEQALGDHPGVREAAVVAHTPATSGGAGGTRLVGYVVYEENADLGAADLRAYLKERLPEYMVPASLVELGSLPLTPNGKVDRDALPAPGTLSRAGEQGYEPPRNDIEKALAEVWSEVLGVESVGIHDDFFELGGDSILSIQLTTRARKAGVEINPRQVFENPTIAELAKVSGQGSKVVAEQGEVTGEMPLLPIQQWYFGQEPADPNHFQLPVLLALQERWEVELLEPVVAALLAHHDALRTRFEQGSDGWTQEMLPVPEAHTREDGTEEDGTEEAWSDLLEVHDLSELDREAQDAAVAERSVALKASLDVEAGRVFRTALFDLGSDRRQRLLLAAHHLVVDTVSLQTLVGDLVDGYRQLAGAKGAEKTVELAPKTTSISYWAERLKQHVEEGGVAAEESYWLAPQRSQAPALPVDHPEAENLASGEETLSARLSADLTAQLLGPAPKAYRMGVQEVLLTAVAQTVAGWLGDSAAESEGGPVLVDLEGHGREEIFDDVDLSRTVGWFASLYPVLLDVPASAAPQEALQTAKEQLRSLPGRGGLGWGLLATYGSEETRSALAAQPAAPLLFNYVGQVDRGMAGALPFELVAGDGELPAPPEERRPHLLEINAAIHDGELDVAWTYSTAVHDEATVRRLADSLVERLAALVEHCLSPEAGGYTPADFPLAALSQPEIDEITAGTGPVEDIYSLSPLQQGMLFHTLLDPAGGFYMAQNGHVVEGPLDLDLFRRAWQVVVDRHPALRTSFRWEGLDEPVQVVSASGEVEIQEEDWSAENADEQQRLLDAYLEQDRRRSFALDAPPPLMRFLVAKIAHQRFRIVWSLHQILFDGWSVHLIFPEFAQALYSLSRGVHPQLPQLRPYSDYIAWLQEQDRSREEEYWRRVLAGMEEETPLPYDRPARGPGSRPRGHDEHTFIVDEGTWNRLQERARSLKVTVNTVVQGAWAQLLGRYSRRRDVVFGAVVAGRPPELEGVENMVGLFINTLPVRATWERSEETVEEWLQALQEVQGELRQYEHSALADVQRWAGLPSEQSLFQTMVVFQNYLAHDAVQGQGGDLGEIAIVDVDESLEHSHLPLAMVANPQQHLALSLSYDTSRFDRSTIERLFGHLERLLDELPADPQRPVAEVPMLSAAEREQLSAWGRGEERPADSTAGAFTSVPQRVARQAEAAPDAPAVRGGAEAWSFAELAKGTAAVRTALLARGVEKGTLVGLCLHRTADLPSAMLGVLEAGCAFVPLDPDYPAERLAYMVEDSELSVVLGHGKALDGLPEDLLSGIDVLRLEDLPVEDSAEPVAVSADDLAYLIYTSGTTGKPKAVMVEHSNLAHTTSAAQQRFGWEPGDLMLCLASYSFDIFLFECLMPLAGGAAVEVVGREATLDQDALAEHVATATRIHGVPTLLRQVVVHAKEQQQATYEKVRTVFVGGDRVPGDLVTELEEVFPQASIEVLYGPTEATIICSHASPERGAEHWRSLLGRPLPGVELRLLGPDGRPVPAGAPGELFIGGDGVTRGYLGRQELTAERFVELEEGSGERFYASGDLARWIPSEIDSSQENTSEGNTAQLEFLGRADGQVKVRGFRVELGEVETVLRSHPALEEAAVAAVDDGAASGARLVAYAVPAGGESMPGADELRSYCQERLAPYMVPSAFVEREALPLTPTGKVDRRALVSQAGEQAGPSAEYVAPRTEKEEALAEIFAQVLKVEQVGVHDNFFELGGDSILSIQIVGRAKRAGLRVNPAQIFEHPTVAQLAVVAQEGSVVEAEQGLVTGDAPLLPIQHLFVQEHAENASYFNMPMLLELREEMPAEHLKKALHRLYQHHDALRLRLVEEGGGWRLHHADAEAAPELERQDLSAVSDDELAAELEKAAVAVQEGLDPFHGPIFRTVLFDLGSQSDTGTKRGRRLFLVPHHLVIDAVSWRVLLEDLQTLLTQLKTGRDLELLPKTTSFKAWGERLTAHAASDQLAAQIPYWSRSSEVTELPVDFPGGANTVGSLEMAVVTLDEERTRILQHEVPKVYRAQIQETLLTAAAQAVLDWTAASGTGGDAVAVALEGHGREEIFDDVDLSRTVGWFTTLYPVRLAPGRGANPGDALKAVKEQLRGVPDNGLGYGLLRYLRRDENGAAVLPEGPPASLGFNYLGQLDQAMDEEGMLVPASESVGSEVHPEHTRDTLLNLEAQIYQGKLTAGWVYSQNLHRKESAEALAEHFRRRLEQLLEHVASPEAGGYTPSDFPLAALGQSELDRLFPSGRFPNGMGVEDLYPLSPTQSGMLFHTVLEPGGGHYVVQMGGELHGSDLSQGLDEERFLRAWQGVVDRHPALRSCFLWHDLERPLQAVVAKATVPMAVLDWTSLDEAEQAEELERYLEADRRRGFDLSVAPQMRLTLMRKAPAVHQFLWSVHHITTDGWSLSAIFQEVMAFYQGLGQGAVPELPAPPRYRDYVAWLERQDLAAAEEFWRRQLADLEDPAPLRFLEREVRDETAVGSAKVQRYLPEEPSEAVQAFARRSQLTANTVIQGAWALLLARYGHARDVVFGSVVSGRPAELPGVEAMVGLFINTLPVRLRVDGEAQLVPWLKDLQERQVEMRRYEYSPLADVQRWAGLAGGQQGGQQGGHPLFETIVVFENYPMDEVLEEQEAELQLKNPVNTEQTNYAVSLDATPGKQMEMSAVYDPGRYEAQTLERVLDHLVQLLASITEGGDRQLQELTMITAAERSQVLEEWATAPGPAAETTVPAELLRRAEESPEAQALVSAGETLTFGDLAQQATALAHRLCALGVASEVPVALYLERSPQSVVATLAVWLAGGAFVPLDPAYPQERLRFILEDSRPKVLVSRGELPEELAEVLPEEVERLDLAASENGGAEDSAELPTAGSNDLAYRIYTSGTTGRPKAVEVEHGQLAHTLAVARRRFGFAPGDTMIYAASFAFDISLFECFAPLLAGATVHLLGRDEVVDLERFAGALSQVSRVHSVPSLMRGVVGYLEAENESNESAEAADAGSLRQVFLGGDRVPAELVRDVQQHFPEAQVTILYGPTEATIICAAVDLPRPYEGSRSLLGRPLDNVVLRVLDFHGGLAGVGVAGELLIGGPGVARGYLGQPELTADRFVEIGGTRFYKTGDLARWLPDGTLEFLGRADAQVKVRGHRIEPGEVESRLAEHPAVAQVVVVTHDGGTGAGPELVAYHAAPEGTKSAAPAELREFLLERLPAYMVPAYFVALDALPLSPTGKVDRRALPAPESAIQASSAYEPPRTPTEETLAEIWSQLLGAERVGRGDDFFTLGGHSLLATQVASRIRRLLEVDLPLRQVFEHPTLADLGRAVDAARREATGEPLPPLVPVERDGALPLSFAQQRLWFIEQLDPDSPLYNMPLPVRLDGRLDVHRLVAALDRLIARHESLRTVFAEEDGKPVQVVLPAGTGRLPQVDLTGLGEAAEESGLDLARREAALPYDLKRGPLFRTVLVQLAEESWLLMLGQHHIISDGWSSGVLIRELVALYSAPGGAAAAELPGLPVQYADYAVWQRSWLQGERLESELDYWRGKLDQLPPLELATDFPRGAVEDPSAGFAHRRLDAGLSARLEELARDHGSTLFMVLMAGFQALLGKLAGQSSFGVGTPVAGRHHLETEGLIGFFVNTLVMRAELEEDPSFEQLLGRLRSTALDAHAHQDVPFEKLVEELAPERDLDRSPLFQVMFVLQNAPEETVELPGLELRPALAAQGGLAKFDLTLQAQEQAEDGDEAVVLDLEYRAAIFRPASMDRLLEHFEILLRRVVEQPERSLGEISLLSGAERRQVLEEFATAPRDYPRDATIPELFRRQAAATPQAPALAAPSPGGWETVTYEELERRSAALATRLAAAGIRRGDAVGVCLERSPQLIAAVLAVLRAGGYSVPLAADYPAERLRFMVEDTALQVLITEESVRAQLPEPLQALDAILVDDKDGSSKASSEATFEDVPCGPLDLAYVAYTSGSTGRPKGVATPHRAVVRLVREANFADLGAEQVFLQLAPVSFDAATLEIWGPLLNGGRLVLMAPGQPTPEAITATLAEQGVTTLWLTAGLFHLMVDEHVEGLAPVRQLLAGGDTLSPRRVRRVLELADGPTVINGYGPTENTTFTTCWPMTTVDDVGYSVPVGRPISNTTAFVVDGHGRPVPVGAMGELWTGGDGLARGYLGRPALTAERFVPDPFGGEAGGRLYRTGDRVRWVDGGWLEFFGRRDHQVKIRGFRIELGEIEAVLVTHPKVQRAVVVARATGSGAGGAGDKRLVAYVVPAPGGDGEATELTAGELRQALAEELPEYMIPAAFVILEELPLDANGKVDRKALPEPEMGSQDGAGFVAPRTQTEEVLAGIWSELLEVERVGVHDSFFELGGHSLLATQVMSRLRSALGVDVPLRALFEAPTVEGLARQAERAQREGMGIARPPLEPVSRDGDLPLSFAQQRLWFIHQLEPDEVIYNMPLPLRVGGPLDVGALHRSLARIVARHESLRTTFPVVDGKPLQQVEAPRPMAVPLVDLSGLDEAHREATGRELAWTEASRPFDLAHGPLLRGQLVRLTADDHLALFSTHHVVSDGWSLGVLMQEVSVFYRAETDGVTPELPELLVQYPDYAVWQRSWLQGEVLEAEIDYWRQRLAGAPPVLDLPTDRPRPREGAMLAATEEILLPAELSEQLKALGRGSNATLFMVLLAAFQSLLARYSGQNDVSIGTPVAGRTEMEVEHLIGFFVNTLVMRTVIPGDESFDDLVERVRDISLEAHAHQEVPFEKLVEELAPQRDLQHSPLFQVLFSVENNPRQDLDLEGLTLSPLDADGSMAKFDLTLAFTEGEDGLAGGLEYNTDIFDASTAERAVRHLRTLLEAAVAEPGRPVLELPLMTAEEASQLTEEWGWGGALETTEDTLHGLVAASARRAPEALAVRYGKEEHSYQTLMQRSGAVAARLAELGAAPGQRVAVCLERGPWLVPAILGVLRTGAAYVPVDPAYPAERRQLMMDDSGCRLVVTEETLAEQVLGKNGEGAERQAVLLEELGEADTAFEDTAFEDTAFEDAAFEDVAVDPNQLAYVIYTSGSTGRPKGVAIPHRSAAAMVRWALGAFEEEDFRLSLAATSVCFDLSVFELFVPLAAGGSVRLVANALSLAEEPELADGVTLINTVPSAMRELVARKALPESVRVINLAGEALPRELVQSIYQLRPEGRVYNLYGPSEDTTYSTFTHVASGEGTVTIGTPVAGTRAYVVDRRRQLVPVGVPGELLLGGAGLTRGYLGRPALTAERYLPDAFALDEGERLYATGDLVRWRTDGELEFLGRIDHQVKLRGFRIELGEIGARLEAQAGVHEAVTVTRPGPSGDTRLVAYYSLETGIEGEASTAETPTPETLREALREQLPVHMVPALLVALEELPKTPNGKIDRRALPEPRWADLAEGGGQKVAPRTPTEQLVAEIWGELLGAETVGAHDSFFDLGGHSLLATQMVSRLRDALGVEVPLRALFEAPTVAGVARAAEEARRAEDGQAAPPLVPVPRDGDPPLSFAQQRLWFIDRMDPGSALYNMPVPMKVDGLLDVARLGRSIESLTRRHEVLRTRFVSIDETPMQRIEEPTPIVLPLVDLGGLAPEARRPEALRLAGIDAMEPFDLEAGPLLRLSVLRLNADEHVVLANLHHTVCDGWSVNLLVQEVGVAYQAEGLDEPAPLPELPVQYADFAVWQRGWLQGEVLDAEVDYWRQELEGLIPAMELPLDRPRPPLRTPDGNIEDLLLPRELAESLRQLSREHGATLFMTVLAIFQSLLARYSGQPDIAVGTPIAGRTHLEVEHLIGLFVNTLVLRNQVHRRASFESLLEQVKDTTLGAYSHQSLPFEKLVEELAPQRSLSVTPFFQVMFTLDTQAAGEGGVDLPDLKIGPFADEAEDGDAENGGWRMAKFDLTLSVQDQGEALNATLEYSTELFDPETVQRMLGHFLRLAESVVEDPQRALAEHELLSAEERAQVTTGLSTAAGEVAAPRSIPAIVEEWVRRTPDAPAVVPYTGTAWSFQRLQTVANAVAGLLEEHGVGPEAPVGLCLERSPELLAAMLGVLRAGAVYLPLDPAYPLDRLRYVVADAGIEVVITREGLRDDLFESVDEDLAEGAELRPPTALTPDLGTPPAEGLIPEAPCAVTGGDAAAYVLYTSGSTGRPKGVVVPHRAVVNHARAVGREYGLTERDRVLQFAAISFDVAVEEIFPSWSAGAAVVLAPPQVPTPAELTAMAEERGLTVANLPVSFWREWMGDLQRRKAALPDSLRLVVTGSEMVPAAALPEWRELAGEKVELRNAYGLTEATVTAVQHRVTEADGERGLASVPIGRPIDNLEAYVLDPDQRPLPLGVAGELCLAGAGLARGYLGKPALTAERFVPHPLSASEGARLYRTGDRARVLADGVIEFQGRLDQQIKVRGFRVEPGEVEAALRRLPNITEAVVLPADEGAVTDRLVAYLIADGEEPTAASLRAELAETLPSHMVPGSFVFIDEVPLTATGKVDRRRLRALGSEAAGESEFLAARDEIEEGLVEIWKEVLDKPQVGVHDNFFDLGGHSLLGVRLLSRIENRFGQKLPVATLFREPTVEGLAKVLRGESEAGKFSSLMPLKAEGDQKPLFWMHAAGGTVFLYRELAQRLETGRPFYGLQAQGLEGEGAPLGSVESMARHYLKEVRETQPEGPYHLGGWSMGGVIAYEAARQLEAAGQEVASLVLVDAKVPDVLDRIGLADDFATFEAFALNFGIPLQLDISNDELMTMETGERLQYAVDNARRAGALPEEVTLEQVRRYYDTFKVNARALPKYKAEPYGGKILLLLARDPMPVHMLDPDTAWPQKLQAQMDFWGRWFKLKVIDRITRTALGWKKLARGGVEIQRIAGDHFTVLAPENVDDLARRLEEHLRTLKVDEENVP